jgi:hypothetical protein
VPITKQIAMVIVGCCLFSGRVPAYSQAQSGPIGFVHTCNSNGGPICSFRREDAWYSSHHGPDWSCNGDGTQLEEFKFVCMTGPKKGQGWDVWCRVGGKVHDGKCNVNPGDACPDSKGLTQWTLADHCSKPGAAKSNWTPPPGWTVQ